MIYSYILLDYHPLLKLLIGTRPMNKTELIEAIATRSKTTRDISFTKSLVVYVAVFATMCTLPSVAATESHPLMPSDPR